MTPSLTPGKSAQWTRALSGGLLSALVVGIALFLVTFVNAELFKYLRILEFPGVILALLAGLFGHPFVNLQVAAPSVSFLILALALLYWFLFGFGLTYLIKNNKTAIAWWLILVIIPGAILLKLIYSLAGIFT